MAKSKSEVARALRKWQACARQRTPPGQRLVRSGDVPEDLATDEVTGLALDQAGSDALRGATRLLAEDLRFEYLDPKELDKALWRYTCECFLDRSADEVQAFIRQYARPIIGATCYVAVEYLNVDEERHVAGVRLLPRLHRKFRRPVHGSGSTLQWGALLRLPLLEPVTS